jgi:hypothetical protein
VVGEIKSERWWARSFPEWWATSSGISKRQLLQWYDDLPRDPVEAFIYLEELFRNRF